MRQIIGLEREDLHRLKAGEVLTRGFGGQSVGLSMEHASYTRPKIDVDLTPKTKRGPYKKRGHAPRHGSFPCQECGQVFMPATGRGSHRHATHGINERLPRPQGR